MTTLIKLGIAVACLLGVAAFITIDMATSKRNPEPAPTAAATAGTDIIPPAVIPVIMSQRAPDAVLCPSPAPEPAVKKAEPAPAPAAPAPTPPAAPPEALKQYTVVQGDTLYGISVKVYGTPRHYTKIYEANRDRINDPNTLQIGINLRMPVLPKAEPVGVAPQSGEGELAGR